MKKLFLFANSDIFAVKVNQIIINFFDIMVPNSSGIHSPRVGPIILDFRINNELINSQILFII